MTATTERRLTLPRDLGEGKGIVLRAIKAAKGISRVELSKMVNVKRSTVSTLVAPLVETGLVVEQQQSEPSGMGRPRMGLSLRSGKDLFIGLNLGVNHSQIGISGFETDYSDVTEFVTPADEGIVLDLLAEKIGEIVSGSAKENLRGICITVPGPVDSERKRLIVAPHLGWKDLRIVEELENHPKLKGLDVQISLENDATASAIYETRRVLQHDGVIKDYLVVRSGSGIGAGIIANGYVSRGSGEGRGFAGEFGHMTIVAEGRECVCGNQGCWEQYASALAATRLYGELTNSTYGRVIRFRDLAELAFDGDNSAIKTLEQTGRYLGIGIANIMLGTGIANIIVSGRLTFGWSFMEHAMKAAIGKSMAGELTGWNVRCGAKSGGSVGGAFEVAVNDFFSRVKI